MNLLNDVTIVLLISHVLGDFHFQSQEMSDKKITSSNTLAKHYMIHALLLIGLPLLTFGWHVLKNLWFVLLIVWASHCVIDSLKSYLSRSKKYTRETLYIADQLVHILLIIVVSEHIFLFNPSLTTVSSNALRWVFLMLMITKPANITFKIVFQKYQFKTEAATMPGAGAVIGNLERMLSVLFLAMNQISAIGFIYTAKSIARFKEIDENKGFAEYYLIGTLFSILYVVIAYIVII